MTNTEFIAALRYCPSHGCGRCIALDANGVCTGHGIVGMMNSAADLIEAQAKRISELGAQLPKEREWMKNIRWYYQQPTQIVATTDGTHFMCRSTGKPCPNATEYGYCKQTVCNNSGEWMKGEQE